MYLVIGNKEKINMYPNEKMEYFKDICSLKYLKQEYDIILLDEFINDDGIVSSKDYFFEEILISIKVNKIITNSLTNKLIEICNYYKIDLIYIK